MCQLITRLLDKAFDKRMRSRLLSTKNRRIKLEQNKKFCNYCILAPIYWYAQFYPDMRGTVDMTVHQ